MKGRNNSNHPQYSEFPTFSSGLFTTLSFLSSTCHNESYKINSISSLVCVIVGFVYLFSDYAGCTTGKLLVSITLIFGIISTILSVTDKARFLFFIFQERIV